jgi:histidinol-phosphate phosphatase family protein
MNLLPGKLSQYTLFLDRDGVINRRIPEGYVTCISEFEFLPGVPEAISFFSGVFNRIIVVSNQQGVGKGLMTAEDVGAVHAHLRKQTENQGGKIDGIYFCPALKSDNDPCRKPATGMADQARKDFSDINPQMCIMAGDSRSDLLFARNLNMVSVYIQTEPERKQDCEGLYDFKFGSLNEFSIYLKEMLKNQ